MEEYEMTAKPKISSEKIKEIHTKEPEKYVLRSMSVEDSDLEKALMEAEHLVSLAKKGEKLIEETKSSLEMAEKEIKTAKFIISHSE